jgi:hypothetical protein
MLSERPNVRVHNDPLRMCTARESRRRRGAIRLGALFGGYTFFAAKERVQDNLQNDGVENQETKSENRSFDYNRKVSTNLRGVKTSMP